LVPNASAEVVSHINSSISTKPQYAQFLHALCKSIVSTGRIESRIILIEVHNIVAGNTQELLPLESDPAMFFLIRLGAFGLDRIIIEAAGNAYINLDTLPKGYYKSSIWGAILSEFQKDILNRADPYRPQRLINSNSTLSEQTSDSGFLYSSIDLTTTTTNWLTIWKARPSGAILIAGYEKTRSGTSDIFNCKTNYGSKVNFIGCGRDVKSCSFNFRGRGTSYKDENFNCSSAASAIMTGVIASALSKSLLLTEGDIKRVLLRNSSGISITPTGSTTMKVPNVQNLYQCLGLPTSPAAP
jgi:hypothetical protein